MNDLPQSLRLYSTELRDAIARDLGRRSPALPRWALRVAAPAVAIAGAAAAVVLVLSGGPEAPSANAAVLRHVAAALTPPAGTILHERALVTLAGQPPAQYEL